MLEGYKPIDFGNMFANQGGLSQIRNRVGLSQAAMNILANSRFKTDQFLSMGLDAQGKPPPRKQTLWGRAVDLLSTPAYMISNAADSALAGHQSSGSDSVLSDIGQVLGGVATGAGRGLGTGIRGAFAPSEIAADPKDKDYLGPAIQRWDLGMSSEDALKPENKEKVRKRLGELASGERTSGGEFLNFIPIVGGWLDFYDSQPDDDGNISDEDIDKYFAESGMQGLFASLATDPLNVVGFPGTAAKVGKGAKGTAEIPGALAEINKGMPSGVLEGGYKAPGSYKVTPKTLKDGSYRVDLNPGAVQNAVANPATGELIKPPAWFDFPTSPGAVTPPSVPGTPAIPNATDDLDMMSIWAPNEGIRAGSTAPISSEKAVKNVPVAKIPDEQISAANKFSKPEEITKLTGDLLRRMISEEGSTNALGRLSTRYPGVKFPRTNALIERFGAIPDFAKRLANPSHRKQIVSAFNRVIKDDAQAMKVAPKVKTSDQILNEASSIGPVALSALVEGARGGAKVASKNPARDSKVAQEVFDKFIPQISGAKVPAGINNPAAYNASVAAGKTARYSGSQQVQMWNQITHQMKNVKTPQRFAVANSILRQVEEMFIAKGFNPLSGYRVKGSTPLRLSQVLDAIGPAAAAMNPTLLTKVLRGEASALSKLPAEVIAKIEELKAGEAIVDGTNVIKGVEAGSKNIEDIIKQGPLSAARTEEVVTIGSKVAEDIARAAGGSPVASKTASQITKSEFIPKAAGDGFPVTNTTALISHPDVSTKAIKQYSNATKTAQDINKMIGGEIPKVLGTKFGTAARAVEWLGARFNAAYKNPDMRPIYLREAATAKSTVARRAQYLNNLAKTYSVNDLDLWNDALKGAQGRMAPVSGSQAEALSKEIIQVMENMFGSSGLKSSVALENSVVGRSQLFMKELNSNLKRFGLGQFNFTKKGDYAEGTKWLNSWESWKIEQPLDFLFKMQNVVEHTVREKLMFDEIIARFGVPKATGEFRHSVKGNPRLQGYYFGSEAASQINQFNKLLKEISTPNSKAMQNFDKVLSKWKAGVTIYVPSHHIRNLIGDTYFNWLGGVNNTRVYSTALKVMKAQKGRYNGLDEMGSLTSPDALMKVMQGRGAPGAVGKNTALTMRNGRHVTNDEVYVSAFQQGILPTTRVLEDIPDDVAMGIEKIRPLGGKGQKAAHTISEGRDHYIRLAHYIDALKKSSRPFEGAVEEAAATVRKWHPDGMDLTKFERNVMRRVFPFYSWTRKAFPLIVESMVATPGKVMAIPKAQYALQNMLGVETGPMSDPFPYDQLFPDWIREKGIGPIMGGPGDYTVINPGNPTMDLTAQMSDPGKMAMGMLNPAARIPIEVATGADTQSGAPISMTDPDYLAKQIPGVSHLGRASGQFGVSDTTKEQSPQGYNMQNIINMLTALGMQDTGPYQKSAEFDLREYLRSLR